MKRIAAWLIISHFVEKPFKKDSEKRYSGNDGGQGKGNDHRNPEKRAGVVKLANCQ